DQWLRCSSSHPCDTRSGWPVQFLQDEVAESTNMSLSRHIHAARPIGLRGHAKLCLFTDLPVLAIDHVEDGDGVAWIEIRRRERRRVEEPVADNSRAIGGFWMQGVDDYVIIEQIEQDIGRHYNTVVTAQIGGEQAGQGGTRRFAGHRECFDALS